MNLPPRRDAVRQFWLAVRAVASMEEAVAGLVNSRKTGPHYSRKAGWLWFRQAGGVVPAYVTAQSSGRFLSFAEREEIHAGVERGDSIRRIAARLGRAPSTVFHELRRNMRQRYRRRNRQGRAVTARWSYRPSYAQRRAEFMARRPKSAKLATLLELRQLVQAKLEQRLSPRQISVELRQEFPDKPEMWVSHEAIYQSIYVQGRGALRRELAAHLRTGRALRKPRRKANERRGRIPDMVNISQRPAEVEDRAIPGHWEGDLLLGRNGKTAIGTLVERSTRFVMLLHLPNGHSPLEVEKAIVGATQKLPGFIWKSLTWDQGQEMRNHIRVKMATGLQVYFCDPASPWQRGSNENTNGLLRQDFPKGTDLSQHGADHLDFVAAQMNRRPRQTLGWLRPAQALSRLLSAASQSAGVATTG
ncbi:MAG TPA: IS30 family transposase [Candidatus Dormibacteraeota bacterium]|nr:IS30 family transposase [Candidatus Dormibacteraeota bacterium]